MLDVVDDFPLLKRTIDGDRIVYLDSAATTLKPQTVIDAVTKFYTLYTSNVHRAIHQLAHEATEQFEGARDRVAAFIGAESSELVLTRGTTDAINLVHNSVPRYKRTATTLLEHHSNFLPWAFGPDAQVIGLTEGGEIDLDQLARVLDRGVDLVAVSYVTNVHGQINPVAQIVEMSHAAGARVMLDAAQAVGHLPIDVKALELDYMAFSAHKMMGPSGIGGLYVRQELYDEMVPAVLGGHMVEVVHPSEYELQAPPACFEPGTPAIEAAIGWGAAVDYLAALNTEAIEAHCRDLVRYTFERLHGLPKLRFQRPKDIEKISATVAFNVEGIEAHGLARIVSNRSNVCLRSGFHCAQPLHESMRWTPTVRVSFHAYNTRSDVDVLAETLEAALAYL